MKNRLNYPAEVLASGLLFLTACGGGGGGGGTPPAPVPVPAPPGPVPAGTLSFQSYGTTVAYQPASATALVTGAGVAGVAAAASGQGGTMTIIADQGGGATTVAFIIPTTGATFTQQIVFTYWDDGGIVSKNVPTADQIAANLLGTWFPPSGFKSVSTALFAQSIGAQYLNYAAYGVWAVSDTATAGRTGTFAFGNLTPAASVPATGSATFNGVTIGVGGSTGGSTLYALAGNAQIVANFATQSVTTNLTNLGTQDISTRATGSLPNLTGTSAISGNAYAGPISGTGLTGTINGNFYGPAAQETAGVWQASGGGNSWIGSYGAK